MPRTTRSLPWRAALAAALTLSLATCSEPTGPANALDIELKVLSGTLTEMSSDGENPSVRCTVPIRATASGPGRAFWLGSTLRWFAGPTRTVPFDTATFSPDVMASAFGFIEMTGGQQQDLQLRVGFGLPFEWELEARYNVGAEYKSAKVRMSCGPILVSGTIAPPTVGAPVVTGRDLLRAGDTITVTMTSSSPYALWHTRLVLSGPVDREFLWAEQGSSLANRFVVVVVPPNAVRDAALVATVTVVDALGQQVTRETITPKIVTDLEPPVLTSARFLDWNGTAGGPGIPQFGPGDTLAVRVSASDDIGLSQLVYEADGPGVSFRDSVPFSAIADSTAIIPVGARWAGVNRLSVYLRDGAQKRSVDAITTPVDSINFFPYVARAATTMDIAEHWRSGIYDSPRQRFYFPRLDARIEVVDAASMTRLTPITLPSNPAGLDVSAAGDTLVVAMIDAGIALVDLRGPAPVTTFVPMNASPAAGGPVVQAFPYEVKRDAAGRWVVWAMIDGTNEPLSMYFDPVQRTFTHIPRDAGPKQTVYVAQFFLTPSPDRTSMVVVDTDCVRLYRSSTARFGPCRPMLQWVIGVPAPMFSPAGDVITIGQGVYDATLGIAAQQGLARPTSSTNVAHSADGTTRWIVENDHLDRLRVSDGRRLARTTVPAGSSRIWLSADGDFLYIESRSTTALTRIDLR